MSREHHEAGQTARAPERLCSRVVRTLRRYRSDILAVLLLTAISLYLTRPLLNLGQTTFGDITMSAAWLDWFKESVVTFHQLPTWSPLWMGGMPFFGMVPPGVFYAMLPLYLVTSSTAVAYNIALIGLFALAGLSMYFYLKHLTADALTAFLGAVIYIVLPVHTQSMMFWGLFEILGAYAIMPLILLLTDLFLKRRSGLALFLLAVCITFVLLSQIEYAVIFLLFYIPYALLSLWARRTGPRQLLSIARANKLWVLLTALLLLVPFSFYVTVIREYDYFSGLTAEEIGAGLRYFTFHNFMQTFGSRAYSAMDTWTMPHAEHYSGPIAFAILLGAVLLVSLEKNRRHAARLLFFVAASLAFLLLSMGIYGPLFPILRQAVPVLKGMRVTLRFYYCFALCLPVVFALACQSARSLRWRGPRRFSAGRLRPGRLIPAVLVLVMVLDFSPYFGFYHQRIVERDQFDQWQHYVLDSIAGTEGNVRIQFYPSLGVQAEYCTGVFDMNGEVRLVEMASTSLPWNQTTEVTTFSHAMEERLVRDEDHLAYYSNLLAIDYYAVIWGKLPPAPETMTDYHRDKIEQLSALSNGPADPLIFRGVLDNDYYRIYLYEVKKSPEEVRFYSMDSTIFIPSEDPFISLYLFRSWSGLKRHFSTDYFQSSVAAVWGDVASITDPSFQWSRYSDIPRLMKTRGQQTALPETRISGYTITARGLSFDVDAGGNGIVSLCYFHNPWWKVYIDGQRSGLLRVNGVLAGAYVTGGQHHIEFVFDYPSVTSLVAGAGK